MFGVAIGTAAAELKRQLMKAEYERLRAQEREYCDPHARMVRDQAITHQQRALQQAYGGGRTQGKSMGQPTWEELRGNWEAAGVDFGNDDRTVTIKRPTAYGEEKKLTFVEELRAEVDEWLKDVRKEKLMEWRM